jgi:hypothetical protein
MYIYTHREKEAAADEVYIAAEIAAATKRKAIRDAKDAGIYIYICIYILIYIFLSKNDYAEVYINTYTCICINIYLYTYIYMHTSIP